MKFLTNIYDPKRKDAKQKFEYIKDKDSEWARYLKWLSNNTIGKPQATDFYSVEELESMGIVGVYSTTGE